MVSLYHRERKAKQETMVEVKHDSFASVLCTLGWAKAVVKFTRASLLQQMKSYNVLTYVKIADVYHKVLVVGDGEWWVSRGTLCGKTYV